MTQKKKFEEPKCKNVDELIKQINNCDEELRTMRILGLDNLTIEEFEKLSSRLASFTTSIAMFPKLSK